MPADCCSLVIEIPEWHQSYPTLSTKTKTNCEYFHKCCTYYFAVIYPYLSEALFQVVRQEAIEHRVGTGIGVGQDDGKEVDASCDAGLRDNDDQIDHVDDKERQPAEDKHHHDHHHHPCHLAL